MKKYYTYTVKRLVIVQHLVTIEYFETDSHFSYPEESHDFYEFVFVENGRIFFNSEDTDFELNRNELFLIPPHTPHTCFTKNGEKATVIIVCFKSKSSILSILKGTHFIENDIKDLIKKIFKEAKETFVFPFNEKLTLNSNSRLGSQQLIENYIEEVLIKLIQAGTYDNQSIQVVADPASLKNSIVDDIIKILKDSIYSKITLDDICNTMLYSKTFLNGIFKELTGSTIMQYYQKLKIKEARHLLDKGKSIAEISYRLNYESPQYFAKVFRKYFDKTPSDYKIHKNNSSPKKNNAGPQ